MPRKYFGRKIEIEKLVDKIIEKELRESMKIQIKDFRINRK